MSHFDLFIDDDNEIKFDVMIEGTDSGSVSSRLINESGDGLVVGFEILIDDRRFIPLDRTVALKKSVKVEAAVKTNRITRTPKVSAILSEDSKAASINIDTKKKSKRTLEDLISKIERN